MLDSFATFDVPTRVRELELSITRRLRETVRPHVEDPAELEQLTRELILIARDFAGSFQAISNRARIREEQTTDQEPGAREPGAGRRRRPGSASS